MCRAAFQEAKCCSEFIENRAAADFIFLRQKEGTEPPCCVTHSKARAASWWSRQGNTTPGTPTLLGWGIAVPGEHLRQGKCWQSNSRVIQNSKFCPSHECFVMIKSGFSHVILIDDSAGNSSQPQVSLCPVSIRVALGHEGQ